MHVFSQHEELLLRNLVVRAAKGLLACQAGDLA